MLLPVGAQTSYTTTASAAGMSAYSVIIWPWIGSSVVMNLGFAVFVLDPIFSSRKAPDAS